DRALSIAKTAFGSKAAVERILEAKLELVPFGLDLPGRSGQFEPGRGVEWAPVWKVSVERAGGTPWLVQIDAASGLIVELRDLRQFATAQVHGGVRSDATVADADLPMPVADL